MITKALLRDLRIKSTGEVIKAGTVFSIAFSPNGAMTVSNGDKVFNTRLYSMFFKAPSLATLERWSDSGVAKTPTGHKVEPDGIGPDGAPSWLLIMGLI